MSWGARLRMAWRGRWRGGVDDVEGWMAWRVGWRGGADVVEGWMVEFSDS